MGHPVSRFAGVVVVVTAGAVLASEYAIGAGMQWGGRYYSVGFALVAVALVPTWARLGPAPRRVLAAGLTATALATSLAAVLSLRDTRRLGQAVFADLDRCAAAAGPSGSAMVDARPIVLSTPINAPSLDWSAYDRYQWLAPRPGAVAAQVRRLEAGGVHRFVLYAASSSTDTAPYRAVRACGPDVWVMVDA